MIQQAADGLNRCWWCGDDPLYVAYHDEEWGRPLRDERALFELLCLEGFQAGLNEEETWKFLRGNAIRAFGLERLGITT